MNFVAGQLRRKFRRHLPPRGIVGSLAQFGIGLALVALHVAASGRVRQSCGMRVIPYRARPRSLNKAIVCGLIVIAPLVHFAIVRNRAADKPSKPEDDSTFVCARPHRAVAKQKTHVKMIVFKILRINQPIEHGALADIHR